MNFNKSKILNTWDFLFIVLLLALTLYFLYGGMGFPSLHSFSQERVFLRACSIFLVAGICLSSIDILKKYHKNKLFLIFIFFELIYVFWHFNFFSFKKIFIDASLFFMFFYSIPRTRALVWLGKLNWILVTVIVLLVLPLWGFSFSMWHQDNTYRGGFIHRNELGYFLVVLFIFFSQSKLNSKIKFVLTFIYFAFLWLCCSRSALLSSLVVWGGHFLIVKRRVRAFFIILIIHISIALSWKYGTFIFNSFVGIETEYEGRIFETATLERWQLIQNGVKAYVKNPIMGKGKVFLSDTIYNKNLDVNNFYLSHLISYGVFPSIVVTFLFFSFFRVSRFRVKLMLINLAIFAAFQAFFDYFQSSYFYITILIFYLFNYLDYEKIPVENN